ncbi:MAG: cbb3-type cytochrome oxidase assembly protein CcoS [Porticoccus sp.]|nr:cbb3-type cytochrome oxidase assembly protein CcoS [Porticoccus sp.]MBQ0807515.1 cbb3-type cytochrome oxidase assembly protein CcoS [Porticoccus sp.]
MASLYLLIPVSLIFCALAIAIFFWAVNNGQYDDLDGEGERILFGDDDDLEPSREDPLQQDQSQQDQSQQDKPREDTSLQEEVQDVKLDEVKPSE